MVTMQTLFVLVVMSLLCNNGLSVDIHRRNGEKRSHIGQESHVKDSRHKNTLTHQQQTHTTSHTHTNIKSQTKTSSTSSIMTASQLSVAIGTANKILQNHRNDDELLEILGHVWNTANKEEREEMLYSLSDHQIKPDHDALSFKYHYTENENSPRQILIDAVIRRESAIAYSTLLNKVPSVIHKSLIISESLWSSLSTPTRIKIYHLFDLNDLSLRALTESFECPKGESKDNHQKCYSVPPCVSPYTVYYVDYSNSNSNNICVLSCVTNTTCPQPNSHCLMDEQEGYCDTGADSIHSDDASHIRTISVLMTTLGVVFLLLLL
jgi:hypothetical protein